jgi:uncharacterized protein YgfB (UPF0149 family)
LGLTIKVRNGSISTLIFLAKRKTIMTYAACHALHETAELCAAEAHGLATGLLCTNHHAPVAQWLNELNHAQTAELSTATTDLLTDLFKRTQALIIHNESAFTLFLPDDDAPLSQRLVAFIAWCQGFLLGIGINTADKQPSDEVRDILKDFIEFTKLDSHSDGSDDDEAAYAELVEYCRSAVLILHDELQA